MLDAAGRVILISGASRGIGRAVAQVLYDRGYSLSLGVRDTVQALETFGSFLPERVHIARFVAEDWATHRDWVAAAAARFGRIDGLVNNAGAHSAMTLRAPDAAEGLGAREVALAALGRQPAPREQ